MRLQIAPVSMPADLAGQTNGKLNTDLLVTVEGGGRLHHLTARAWNALVADAWTAVQLPLTYTYGGTYRSYGDQETLFRSRYTPNGPGGGCKTWNGVRWCKKNSNLATAAVPGTSNHGWGLAVDSAWDKDLSDGLGPDDATYISSHPGWQWLLVNAEEYGFSWELQSEPWHLRYVAGDNVPAAVLAFEGGPRPEPEPEPEPLPQLGDDVSTKTILVDMHLPKYPYGVWYLCDAISKTWVQNGHMAEQLKYRVMEATGQQVDYSVAPAELPASLTLSDDVAIDGHRYSVVRNGNVHLVASFGPIIGPRLAGVDEYGR